MAVLFLEVEGGGGAADEGFQEGDFFGVDAVVDALELFLRALDGGLGGGFVDVAFAEGHVGQDDDFCSGDFGEAGADGEGDDLAVVEVAEFAGLERGDESGVHRKNAHLAVGSGEVDVFNRVREDFLLGGDDVEVEGHEVFSWKFSVFSEAVQVRRFILETEH